jgi:hypothetical protein
MEKGCVDVVLGLREMIEECAERIDCLLLSDTYKVPRGLRDDGDKEVFIRNSKQPDPSEASG